MTGLYGWIGNKKVSDISFAFGHGDSLFFFSSFSFYLLLFFSSVLLLLIDWLSYLNGISSTYFHLGPPVPRRVLCPPRDGSSPKFLLRISPQGGNLFGQPYSCGLEFYIKLGHGRLGLYAFLVSPIVLYLCYSSAMVSIYVQSGEHCGKHAEHAEHISGLVSS